ncbi:MAG: hypothetical protein ACOCYZ_03200 [Halococcoides sp.]
MAYVETDFLLALYKDDDWLSPAAERIYEDRDDLWTGTDTLVELMLVGYRHDWNVLKLVGFTRRVVDVHGDVEPIVEAASYVEEDGFTPLDALHLVRSGDDPIVSSESDYDGYSERIALESLAEGED